MVSAAPGQTSFFVVARLSLQGTAAPSSRQPNGRSYNANQRTRRHQGGTDPGDRPLQVSCRGFRTAEFLFQRKGFPLRAPGKYEGRETQRIQHTRIRRKYAGQLERIFPLGSARSGEFRPADKLECRVRRLLAEPTRYYFAAQAGAAEDHQPARGCAGTMVQKHAIYARASAVPSRPRDDSGADHRSVAIGAAFAFDDQSQFAG